MLLFYSNRLIPYAYVGYCFLLELFLLGFADQPVLPFVGIGFILCLMKFAPPLSFYCFSLLLILMTGMIQGLTLGKLFIFWLLAAFAIFNFRFLLYSSRLVHLVVISCVIAVFSLWNGLDVWTVWNFFGILSLLPIMVNNFV